MEITVYMKNMMHVATRLARQAKEDFHTEIAKITTGHTNWPVSRGLVWTNDRFAWHGKLKKIFTQRSQRSQRQALQSPVSGGAVWMDDRLAWHGNSKKLFTQRSQRSQRQALQSPVSGGRSGWTIDSLGTAIRRNFSHRDRKGRHSD
jgi:hypothetical protein